MNSSVLYIVAPAVAESIAATLRKQMLLTLKRKGAVVAVSGGIDSSVCAALCARALGKDRVLVVSIPDRDSSKKSRELSKLLAERLGVEHCVEDISPVLDAAGRYRRQEEAIRSVFLEYGAGWKSKIVIPSILEGERLNISRLVVEDPNGKSMSARLPLAAYLKLVAKTNFKQHTRTIMAYYFRRPDELRGLRYA